MAPPGWAYLSLFDLGIEILPLKWIFFSAKTKNHFKAMKWKKLLRRRQTSTPTNDRLRKEWIISENARLKNYSFYLAFNLNDRISMKSVTYRKLNLNS